MYGWLWMDGERESNTHVGGGYLHTTSYTNININGISTCFYSFHMQNAIIERHKGIFICVCVWVSADGVGSGLLALLLPLLCLNTANNSVDESSYIALGCIENNREKSSGSSSSSESWSSSVVVRIRRMEQNQLHSVPRTRYTHTLTATAPHSSDIQTAYNERIWFTFTNSHPSTTNMSYSLADHMQ